MLQLLSFTFALQWLFRHIRYQISDMKGFRRPRDREFFFFLYNQLNKCEVSLGPQNFFFTFFIFVVPENRYVLFSSSPKFGTSYHGWAVPVFAKMRNIIAEIKLKKFERTGFRFLKPRIDRETTSQKTKKWPNFWNLWSCFIFAVPEIGDSENKTRTVPVVRY